jgi:hypothetical protein
MISQELKSPVFDWDAGDFATIAGGVRAAQHGDAVAQVIIKAQATPRGIYPIYARPDDQTLDHKYGSDVADILTRRELTEEARVSELKRAIVEAIQYDPWVLEVLDVNVYQDKDDDSGESAYFADYKVRTVFDTVAMKGVKLE